MFVIKYSLHPGNLNGFYINTETPLWISSSGATKCMFKNDSKNFLDYYSTSNIRNLFLCHYLRSGDYFDLKRIIKILKKRNCVR